MNKFLSFGFVAIVLALSSGCASQAQCMRDRADLQAQVQTQQEQLRDVNGRLATESTAKTGDDLSALARDGWNAALGAIGWTKNEAPIAERKVEGAYDATSEKFRAARQCYHDHGGDDAHTLEEYRAIAVACLGN